MAQNLKSKIKAFSLLELVLSIAILSIGITLVMQTFSYSSRMAGLSCDIISAALLAEDKIQELEFKIKQHTVDKELNTLKEKIDKFTYGYTLNSDSKLNLYGLSFEVSWQRNGRAEKINLLTLLR